MMVVCSKELVFVREVDRFKTYLEGHLNMLSQWMDFDVSDMQWSKTKLRVFV